MSDERLPTSQELAAWREATEVSDRPLKRMAFMSLSLLGVAALAVPAGIMGVSQGIARSEAARHKTITITGDSELLDFDESDELHCWTASTIGVHAAVKDEEKGLLDVVIGSKETKVSAQERNRICADLTSFVLTVDPKAKHASVNLKAGAITTESSFVPGSSEKSVDSRGTYAVKDIANLMAGGAPWVRDTVLAKGLASATNGELKEDAQYNMALTLAMANGANQCADTSWTLGAPAVEEGIENIYKRGLYLAQKMYPEVNIQPENIDVLMDGVPLSEAKVDISRSNLDTARAAIQKLADNPQLNFTMNESSEGACNPSDEIKQKLVKQGSLQDIGKEK